jgi:mono/diheme cytochrome c family protein
MSSQHLSILSSLPYLFYNDTITPAVGSEKMDWAQVPGKFLSQGEGSMKPITRSMIGFLVASVILALCSTGAWAADAAAGKAVFGAKCRACHGANGEGNPSMAKVMKVEIKPLSETTSDVKKVITDGQGKMKPVAGVTGADLDNVTAFVQSLKK